MAATSVPPGPKGWPLIGSVLPVILGIFGVFALFAYLGRRRIVVTALVCAIVGSGATLAALGVINYAIPALAHAYQAGNTGAMVIADGFFKWPWGAMIYPAALVPIGLVLFSVALWRSTTISRAAIAVSALSA